MCGWVELGGGLDLAQEPVGAEGGRQLGPQDLERDLAVVLEVAGEVDGGHPALPELALDGVAVGEGVLQPYQLIDHRDGRCREWHYDTVGRVQWLGGQPAVVAPG